MGQKFDELKQKIQNVDKDQAKQVIQQIKQARDNGEINETEKNDLVDKAKSQLGNSDLGGLGL